MGFTQTNVLPRHSPMKRPGVVTVIGIISIVYCSLFLFSSLISYVMMLIFGGQQQMMQAFRGFYSNATAGLYDEMLQVTGKYYLWLTLVGILQNVIHITGLIGGILVFKPGPRGASALKAFAVGSFVYAILSTALIIPYYGDVLGAVDRFMGFSGDGRGMGFATGFLHGFLYIGVVIGVLLMIAWPIIVLILVNQKKALEYGTTR